MFAKKKNMEIKIWRVLVFAKKNMNDEIIDLKNIIYTMHIYSIHTYDYF